MLVTKPTLTLEGVKAIVAQCEAEAKARVLRVVIAIVDDGGRQSWKIGALR